MRAMIVFIFLLSRNSAFNKNMQQRFDSYREKTREWAARTPEEQRTRRRPRKPRYLGRKDMHQWNPNQFMCMLSFPWLNRSRG
jgi:hypothetical protein